MLSYNNTSAQITEAMFFILILLLVKNVSSHSCTNVLFYPAADFAVSDFPALTDSNLSSTLVFNTKMRFVLTNIPEDHDFLCIYAKNGPDFAWGFFLNRIYYSFEADETCYDVAGRNFNLDKTYLYVPKDYLPFKIGEIYFN